MQIFYRPEMSASTDSYSPSSAKPRMVIGHWLEQGFITPDQIQTFDPVTRSHLYQAHDPAYVNGVLDLEIDNGFGNRSAAVAQALPYTTGSMVAATNHVLQHGGHACSPTSGFHHAYYDEGGGFCTFNGLALATILAAQQGAKVGILDMDAHYGDGTDNILARHRNLGIRHHTFGQAFPPGKRAAGWSTWMDAALDNLQGCDVVLYQAGADPHVDDPLGGQLTSKEMAMRDAAVFSSLPNVAWNLAGGYQRDKKGGISYVLHLHTVTLIAQRNAR